MAGHGEKLTRRREQALAALLAAPSITAAAGQMGINEKTLRLWLRDPDFSRAYREVRRQVVEHAVMLLQQTTSLAVATLHRNLTCGAGAVEVRAALGILEHALGAVELMDLAQQVEELRAELAEMRCHGAGHTQTTTRRAAGAGAQATLSEPAADGTGRRPGADPRAGRLPP